ncbi:MAG: YciI family protein [Thermoflavifilum sp.]|nr:YciI family protein [Thermoflavifilum sp.]
MYYVLLYDVVTDYVERRKPFREAHLKLIREMYEQGYVVMAGALDNPPDRAILVFYTADTSIIKQFIERDPYVQNGLVTHWEIRPWNVVVGGKA